MGLGKKTTFKLARTEVWDAGVPTKKSGSAGLRDQDRPAGGGGVTPPPPPLPDPEVRPIKTSMLR